MPQKILVVTGHGPAHTRSPMRLRDLIKALDAKTGIECLPHAEPTYNPPVTITELEELVRGRK